MITKQQQEKGLTQRIRVGSEEKSVPISLDLKRFEETSALAAEIAHDFNNLLTVILGNLQSMRMEMKGEEPLLEFVLNAESACRRGGDLADTLLSISRGRTPIEAKVDSLQLIHSVAKSVQPRLKTPVELALDRELWKLKGSEKQLRQMLECLIINADESMRKIREAPVKISARNYTLPKSLEDMPIPQGDYALITVTDEGEGIPQEILPKIFEPYFSTKKEGRGLGLSVVYSVVDRHGGYVHVDSLVNKGSVFTIYLPAIREASEFVDTFAPPSGAPLTARIKPCRILVVDYEQMIRTVCETLLNHLGHAVSVAKDVSSARAMFESGLKSERPFDLVITDLTMLGDGTAGLQVLKEVRRLNPKIKVIVMSGYSHHNVMEQFRDYGFNARLAKPFEISTLNRSIHEALGLPTVKHKNSKIASNAPPLNSGDQLSHYEIVKLIAEGGMGYVYKAHEPALDRMVAIKLLKPEFVDNQEVVECFEREARAIAELRHQNIISIHYIQRAERFYFFVMDYIDGCTVEDWVKAGRCFTLAEAKYFMTQAISALDAAAKAQLIHLDIKPSNFLVDAQGTIVLTDFGLAQKIGQIVSAEEKEYVFGTPYYVAPEQASGEPTDMRSDIYSLGATLYHLMVGAPPFEGKTTQVLKSHTAEPFPFNKALLSGVPKDWLEFIRKMMEADPKDRWQNYDVLSRALSQLPPKTLPATMSGLGRPAYSKTPQRPANIAETYVYDTAPLR